MHICKHVIQISTLAMVVTTKYHHQVLMMLVSICFPRRCSSSQQFSLVLGGFFPSGPFMTNSQANRWVRLTHEARNFCHLDDFFGLNFCDDLCDPHQKNTRRCLIVLWKSLLG